MRRRCLRATHPLFSVTPELARRLRTEYPALTRASTFERLERQHRVVAVERRRPLADARLAVARLDPDPARPCHRRLLEAVHQVRPANTCTRDFGDDGAGLERGALMLRQHANAQHSMTEPARRTGRTYPRTATCRRREVQRRAVEYADYACTMSGFAGGFIVPSGGFAQRFGGPVASVLDCSSGAPTMHSKARFARGGLGQVSSASVSTASQGIFSTASVPPSGCLRSARSARSP